MPQDVEMSGRLGVWLEPDGTPGAAGPRQLQADVRHVSLHGAFVSDAQLRAGLEAHRDAAEPICSSLLPHGALRAVCCVVAHACMQVWLLLIGWVATGYRLITALPTPSDKHSCASVSCRDVHQLCFDAACVCIFLWQVS